MTDPTPIAVSAHGFSWTAAGAWATFLALIGAIIRQVGPWKKQTSDAEAKLRDGLMARVEKLERSLEQKDKVHAAERSLNRHKIRNLNQCLDAVLMILETAPEKTVEVGARCARCVRRSCRRRRQRPRRFMRRRLLQREVNDGEHQWHYRGGSGERGRLSERPT